ncbi:hypothetical protein DB88DRAFT_500095 [Papiliotrema laurentii]|uniref:Uncharacterized protein n=1 Tax=Papiliotrema laurentii TaxID=5418 RepID=A0AAD9FMR1_PAPLA|nr:hypothetical protein DB88DRAFT_500095 [Papiliotrema laurentii]
MRYEDVPRKPGRVEYRPEEYRQDRNGNVFRRPASKRYIPGEGGGQRIVLETVEVVPTLGANSDRPISVATRHLAALRNSALSPWYSTDKPPLALGLLIGIGIIAMLVVVTGKILHAAYDKDKIVARKTGKGQDIEAWYIRELQKRKVETEQETLKRDKAQEAAFVGRLRKMTDEEKRNKEIKTRREEIQMLKKELKRRKMPIIGLDWDFEGNKKKKNTAVSKGVDKLKGMVGVGKKDDPQTKSKQSQTSDGTKEPGKLKKMLLGPFASGPPKDTSLSANKPSASGNVRSGPGWRAADDAVAHAAIRGGAARAENLANSLVKQKAEG